MEQNPQLSGEHMHQILIYKTSYCICENIWYRKAFFEHDNNSISCLLERHF